MVFKYSTSTAQHLIRTITPSLASGFLCAVCAICFVGGCIFLDSVSYGTVVPDLAGGEPATAYTNTVVQPVETIIHSVIWNNMVAVLLWSLTGLLVYELLEAFVHLVAGWRTTRHDIQYINRSVVVKHPLEKSFLFRAAWRLGVTIVAFITILLAQPLMRMLFGSIHTIIMAQSVGIILKNFLLSSLGWVLIMHCIVIFLRLYTLRIRLFGDVSVYES